jgi:two-component system C4-dicarboxylate transport sensor histidine kinase DctB
MVNYASIASSRNTAILIALLLIAVIIMGGGMLVNRQNRLRKEQRSQQAFALRLERQVRDRTFALTEANQRLEVEVDERRIAEKNLRETQEELVQAAKLAGIGQMSAALAHEYNQPLAAIRSYADNALIFLTKDQANFAADNLQRIKMLTDKMAGLTRTLRNFAHKSTGRYESVSLEAVMDELIILLSPQAKKLRVKLQLLPPSLPLSVLGDYGRLSQIMTNLTTNAMDAVADSENKRVEITWQQREDKAVISVKDTGSGIDPAVREKMFTAFFTTKNPGSGLGLGLFIVINIVNDLKGTLSIKDEPGYGAVFEVSLPLAE